MGDIRSSDVSHDNIISSRSEEKTLSTNSFPVPTTASTASSHSSSSSSSFPVSPPPSPAQQPPTIVPLAESKASMDADISKFALKNTVVSIALPISVLSFFNTFVADDAAYSWQRCVDM